MTDNPSLHTATTLAESSKETALPVRAYVGLRDVPLVRHLSRTRCGPYTAEWMARAIGMHPIPANQIIKGNIWWDVFRPILPRDMMAILKFRRLKSKVVNLDKLTDEERIQWIKNEIVTKRKPIALLVRTSLLHWIAVAGYNDERGTFYIYDSYYGDSSTNPFLPIGNNVIKYADLAKVWRGRWWLKYRAIVIET